VPVFPPSAPVTVSIDGRPSLAYVRAFVAHGRVFAAVSPLLLRLADRVWFDRGTLVVERDGRRVRVALPQGASEPETTFVEVAPILRALGDSVTFERRFGRLEIRTPAAGEPAPASPPPVRASPVPRTVFTPEPVATPRPVWSGSPLPRRTPLPLPSPD